MLEYNERNKAECPVCLRRFDGSCKSTMTPERPARTDEQEDTANGDDGVVHVEHVRWIRGGKDEENANKYCELLSRGVSATPAS